MTSTSPTSLWRTCLRGLFKSVPVTCNMYDLFIVHSVHVHVHVYIYLLCFLPSMFDCPPPPSQGFMLMCGGQIGFFQGDVKQLVDDIHELRPTIFVSVPRLLNRVYDKVSLFACMRHLVQLWCGGVVGGYSGHFCVRLSLPTPSLPLRWWLVLLPPRSRNGCLRKPWPPRLLRSNGKGRR